MLRKDPSFSCGELAPLFESKKFRSHLPGQLDQWLNNTRGEKEKGMVVKKLREIESIIQDLSSQDDYSGKAAKSLADKIKKP